MPRPTRIRLIGPIREMTREDMAATLRKSFTPPISAASLRDSHHRIARLAAAGHRNFEIAERTGYTSQRISILLQAPAMLELVAKYRSRVDEAFAEGVEEYYGARLRIRAKAVRQIEDQLDTVDETGKPLPTLALLAIAADTDDRIGYSKKQTNFNVNADFAAELERAIIRSGKADAMKVIEVAPVNGTLRRRA